MASATAACATCPANTYRSGDASPENNVCKNVPAGFYANADGSSAGATTITPCAKGYVSYWTDDTTRVPSTPLTCEPCGSATTGVNTYAPRAGMTACLACKGGSIPNAAKDGCDACGAGTYRSFYTVK